MDQPLPSRAIDQTNRLVVRRLGDAYPWEVELPRGVAELPVASVAKCGEVYTLFKSNLEALSGTLAREQMAQVDRALATCTGYLIHPS